MGERKADAMQVLPIVALVRERIAASGIPSMRELAEKRGVSYSTLQRYSNPNLKPLRSGLRQETMKELALALDVPVSRVQQASDKSVDRVYLAGDDSTMVIIGALEELDEKTRRKVTKQMLDLLASYRTGPH